ncbi:hypothetical protein AURDEDRAFT_145233 [Auricularia subglabra TFB-10046 SS5]|nr:hypothetical protein AURDEDRAFT_145233 [Auricularia subglabra TFB-10046 SS5]
MRFIVSVAFVLSVTVVGAMPLVAPATIPSRRDASALADRGDSQNVERQEPSKLGSGDWPGWP